MIVQIRVRALITGSVDPWNEMVGQLRKREQSWHGYSRAEGESFPWSQGWKKAQKIGRCVRSRRQQKLLVPIICYAHCKERTALRNDVGIELGGALRNETEKNIVLASVNAPAWIRLGGGFATRECKIVDVSSAGVRLSLPFAARIPATFTLLFSKHAQGHRVRTVWRRANEIGVAFIYKSERHATPTAPRRTISPLGRIDGAAGFTMLTMPERFAGCEGRYTLDIRRGGLGEAKLASFFDLPNARLIRKTLHHGDRNPILYVVAVSKADQAVEIIRSKAANPDDHVEDLGRVTGFLVQAFNLAPGEFIRVDGNYKPQGQRVAGDQTR